MADGVVATLLLEKLPHLLLQEANLPSEVSEQINSLLRQLKNLNGFLSDSAKGKQRNDDENMGKIREIVHEAEDVIDTYIYNENRQRIRDLLRKAMKGLDHSKKLHDINSKIKTIQSEIEEITKTHQEVGHVNNDQADADADEDKSRSDVEEDDVVGFEESSFEVIHKLTNKERPQRDVISIVGMGGLGKTTLARKIYKNNQVKKHFNPCAWGNVTNNYKAKQLLLKLLEQLVPKKVGLFQDTSIGDLRMVLRKSLEKKTYLIVLDGIWEPKIWDDVKDAFPDDQKGSRILITSRSHQVANQVSGSSPYKYPLPFLSKEKSWELFSKKVFRGEECPSDLELLAKNMVGSCDGLPLFIVVLAGVLSQQERSKAQWSLVAKNEIWHLLKPEERCREFLELSLNYLPRHLKLCFLYVGFYPKDRIEIPARHLIRLWVAEGLIPEDTGTKQPEDVAELYLQELINRSLIQIASKRTDGGVKTCRVHDLLRAQCIEESMKNNFYEVYTKISNSSTLNKPRRLSLSRISLYSYLSSGPSTDHSSVRSLICSVPDKLPEENGPCSTKETDRTELSEQYWKSLVHDFKLVRVLEISTSIINTIPERIRRLIHLRYLKIDTGNTMSGSDFLSISDYICDLRYLETLDVRGSPLGSLPTRIHELKRLRHLLMSGPVKISDLVEPLENLQSLSTVALDDHSGSFFSTAKFPNLRKLGLYYASSLQWTSHEFWPTLRRLSDLKTLKIIGTTMLPELFPRGLTKITLENLKVLEPNVFALLGAIPNLEILKLSGNPQLFYEFDIDCKNEEFRDLRVFQLRGLACTNWNLAAGAMPRLQSLVISKCKKLSLLPDELWSLVDLQEVQVLWPSKKLAETLQKLKMKDGCKLTLKDEADK